MAPNAYDNNNNIAKSWLCTVHLCDQAQTLCQNTKENILYHDFDEKMTVSVISFSFA